MTIFEGFKLNKNENVYEQIVNHIKQGILSGRIQSDDRLPSRRETAVILSVNPNTVQKAYKLLEDEGLIATDKNSKSCVLIDDESYKRLRDKAITDLVDSFVTQCKGLNLEFKQVTQLIIERWD